MKINRHITLTVIMLLVSMCGLSFAETQPADQKKTGTTQEKKTTAQPAKGKDAGTAAKAAGQAQPALAAATPAGYTLNNALKAPAYIPTSAVYTDPNDPVFKARKDATAATINQTNSFNRLFVPAVTQPQATPALDMLHDPKLVAVQNELLSPAVGMTGLSKDIYGNMVNWVTALGLESISMKPGDPKPKVEITPIEKIDPNAADTMLLDLVVTIPAVGMIPDVKFPHAAHTVWLSCGNCHEAQTYTEPIFNPTAGSNPITMTAIMEGKYCGVCHSGKTEKVAFPIEDCKRCHSGPAKTAPTPIKPYMVGKN